MPIGYHKSRKKAGLAVFRKRIARNCLLRKQRDKPVNYVKRLNALLDKIKNSRAE